MHLNKSLLPLFNSCIRLQMSLNTFSATLTMFNHFITLFSLYHGSLTDDSTSTVSTRMPSHIWHNQRLSSEWMALCFNISLLVENLFITNVTRVWPLTSMGSQVNGKTGLKQERCLTSGTWCNIDFAMKFLVDVNRSVCFGVLPTNCITKCTRTRLSWATFLEQYLPQIWH